MDVLPLPILKKYTVAIPANPPEANDLTLSISPFTICFDKEKKKLCRGDGSSRLVCGVAVAQRSKKKPIYFYRNHRVFIFY
jgi:hypothetical protein